MPPLPAQTPPAPTPPAEPLQPATDTPPADVPDAKGEDEIAGTEELTQSGFLLFLRDALATAEDPDEVAALEELVALVEANPNEERTFIEAFVETIRSQAIAAYGKTPGPVDSLKSINLATETLDESETTELDERAERLRANAQAEIDQLKEASLARQQAAEEEAINREPPAQARDRERPKA